MHGLGEEPAVSRPTSNARRSIQRWCLGCAAGALLLAVVFVLNGTGRGWQAPECGRSIAVETSRPIPTVRVMALNAAKCSFYEGGLRFASAEQVRHRLMEIASVIMREDVDIACLSEVVMEAGPWSVNQVETLAGLSNMPYWATGENYSFGIPVLRIRSGNGIISRFPLRGTEVVQLPGGRPFWNPTNNRRLLLCGTTINGKDLLIGSVRNDSFRPDNNLEQVHAMLERVRGQATLLAGDFNAVPESASMRAVASAGMFEHASFGTPTFPSSAPQREIDYVFAPLGWKLVDHRVVDVRVSDHLAVIASFELGPSWR